MTCRARRVNDQYHCHACGFQWDVDDEDRPMCKPTKSFSGFIAGVVMLSVAGCVQAADLACDATRAAVEAHIVLANIDTCYDTIQRSGSRVAVTTDACAITIEATHRYTQEVEGLVIQGCATYYNGPSRTDRARLEWYSDKFGSLTK